MTSGETSFELVARTFLAPVLLSAGAGAIVIFTGDEHCTRPVVNEPAGESYSPTRVT